MNDNWLEIIEILGSVSKTSDRLALRRAMESCLRMLGWKTINNSMIVDFKTVSGSNIDIVLGNKEADGYHVDLPIIVTSGDQGNNIAEKIKVIAAEVDCESVITLGQTLNLYFKPDDADDYIRIKNISFDQDDMCGSKLANILTSSSFEKEQFNSFCKTIYDEVMPNIKLNSLLDEIINNKDKAKEVLKTYLELEGFVGDYVEDKLEEIRIDINYGEDIVSEPTPQFVSAYTFPHKGNGHDRTKFSINGGPFLSKRRFVHAVVCQYLKDHPSATLDDLEKQFPSSIISKERGVVRPYETVKKWARFSGDDILTRYCTREGEIIRLENGMEVVVNSQWGAKNFSKFLAIAKSNYNVISSEPYSETFNSQPSECETLKKRADNFKFSMAGIQVGENVIFDAKGISLKVVSDNEVEYEGMNYKLSSFVKAFIPDNMRTPSDSYRGPDFFSYKGMTLTDLRNAGKICNIEEEEYVSETEYKDKGIHISAQALNSFKSRK